MSDAQNNFHNESWRNTNNAFEDLISRITSGEEEDLEAIERAVAAARRKKQAKNNHFNNTPHTEESTEQNSFIFSNKWKQKFTTEELDKVQIFWANAGYNDLTRLPNGLRVGIGSNAHIEVKPEIMTLHGLDHLNDGEIEKAIETGFEHIRQFRQGIVRAATGSDEWKTRVWALAQFEKGLTLEGMEDFSPPPHLKEFAQDIIDRASKRRGFAPHGTSANGAEQATAKPDEPAAGSDPWAATKARHGIKDSPPEPRPQPRRSRSKGYER